MKKLFAFLLLIPALAFGQVNNTVVTLFASAARTTTPLNSADQLNKNYRGAHFVINVSAYTSGNYTPHVQAKDPLSGVYYDVLVGPAISATGTTVLKVYPGVAPLANGAAADVLPYTWRVQMIGAASPSMTFTVDAYLEL